MWKYFEILHDMKLCDWSKEDETFVKTRATKVIEETVNQSTITLVTGPPGCGKSATIHHIALKFKEKGYRICPVMSIKNVVEFWMPEQEQVFVLDDPFGVHELNVPELDQWNRDKETLYMCFKYSSIMILTSVRLHIIKDEKVKSYLSPIKYREVALTDANIGLSDNERLAIFCQHASYHTRADLMSLGKDIQCFAISCFPLLCRIFAADKESSRSLEDFFQSPLSVLEKELCNFQVHDPLRYFCLLYCMIYDNKLNSVILDLEKESTENINLRQIFLETCKLSSATSREEIRCKLDTLLNTYLKMEGDSYCFLHDIVHDAIITHINYVPSRVKYIVLQYCSPTFIKENIRLKSIEYKGTNACIILDETFEDTWCGRILKDIKNGHWNDVFNNSCLLSEKGDQMFSHYLHTLDSQIVTNAFLNSCRNENVVDRVKSKNKNISEFIDKKLDEPKCKPLHWVAFAGLHWVLNEISKLPGFSVEEHAIKHLNLLLLSCMKGHVDIVKLLVNEGHYTANTITGGASSSTDDLSPIFVASSEGHAQVAAFLLENGADINAFTREDGQTPLYVSSHNDQDKIVKLLIENGAEINKCDVDGWSPLYASSRYGHDKVVKLLIENGADINKCDKYDLSPLYVSSRHGNNKVVKLLIENGADINKCNNDGLSPLYVSSRNGHDKVVKLLIENGADINKYDDFGLSPLYVSSRHGNNKVVKLLIENGADINKCNNDGLSPLYVSSRNGNDKVVKLLIENGADINKCNKNGDSPLCVSSYNGQDKVVKLLIENEADINKCNNDGWSPLYVSSSNGHDKVVKLLIENGADINTCDKYGTSPLYVSLCHGHDKVVKLLIDNGADINKCNNNGWSPLYVSSNYGHGNVVKLLIENGADINKCDKYGKSPLYASSCCGHDTVVKLLIENGADINKCNNDGWSPLYVSSRIGDDEIVQMLINNGADINKCNNDGESPLYVSSLNGNYKVVKMLIENGADINKCNKNGVSSLYASASSLYYEQYGVAKMLIENGADVNKCNNEGESPVQVASKLGRKRLVNLLITNGAQKRESSCIIQ